MLFCPNNYLHNVSHFQRDCHLTFLINLTTYLMEILILDISKSSHVEISIFVKVYFHLCMYYKLVPKYHRLYVKYF